jgi:hypothetical protein
MNIPEENGFPASDEDAQRRSEKEGRPEIPQHEMLPAHAPNEQIVKALEDLDLDEN